MKATRAYIASIGTTGLLLAFAASLLLVVSALFAFNAWPGAGISDTVDKLFVDGDDDSFRVTGPEQVALDAAPAAVAVAAVPGARLPVGGAVPGSTVGNIPRGGPGGGGLEQTLDVGDGDGDGGGGIGATPVPGPGPGPIATDDITDDVASTTQGTSETVGNGLDAVDPNLGNTVSDTGQALSDIVRELPDARVSPQQGLSIGD